ncbi:MAG: hypothetical protein ABIK15_15760 [Pseudomonadota bacterium]
MMILLILITIAAACGAGFYIYRNFYADPGPDFQMVNIHLKEETITFVYQSMPEIYSSLSRINHELVLIAEEIKRLDLLEKDYPKQKKIVMDEKKMWDTTRKDLQATIENLEKSIETLFVAYTVNTEKGTEMLSSEKEALLALAAKALETSQQHTIRLKNTEEKSWINNIKETISK